MTKNQHYVPRFYLRNFSDNNGYLWAYNTKERCIKKVKPESICAEKYLYETEFINANEKLGKYVLPNNIERKYSKLEEQYSALIKTIIDICSPSQNKDALILHTEEKKIFFSFVANLCVRNPYYMKSLNLSELPNEVYNSDDFKIINKLLTEMGVGGTESIFLAAEKNIMLTAECPNSLPEQMEKYLSEQNYVFFYAQEDKFLTSDVPVIVGEDRSIKDDDKTCLFLPLTPIIAVLFGYYSHFSGMKNKMVQIKRNIVHQFNQQLFEKTQYSVRKWIISSSKSLIESYLKEVK